MAWQEHTYVDGEALAAALAAALDAAARAAFANDRDVALFALAGGRTPLPAYRRFAGMTLDWQRVRVLPTDERCVPHHHAACNVRELREAFESAAGVHIDALTVADGNPARSEAHARTLFSDAGASNAFAGAQAPDASAGVHAPYAGRTFDAVVLGMGLDGHTASLFPGAPQRAEAMDPADTRSACRIDPDPLPPEAPFPRITLTLPRLLDAHALHLAIVGDAKRNVLREAQARHDPANHPISALLHAPHTLVHVHWSPT